MKNPTPCFTADLAFAEWVRALPKAETHLHLEGSTPAELLDEAFADDRPRERPFWRPDFRYKSFEEFEMVYVEDLLPFYCSPQRYHDAARLILAECVAQGCRYVEMSVHLPGFALANLDGREVLAAIREARPRGLTLKIFGGMCHDDYSAHRHLIEEALDWEDLAGIDLHGPEYLPLEPWTAEVWARARDKDKFTKAHAGEFMPAGFVARILDELKVTRIEHGVRAAEDEALVARLVNEGITLDVCPISNLKLAVAGVTEMAVHPLRRLFDAGVKVTINTDDTYCFGNSIEEEYFAASQALGFSRAELLTLARNGIDVALMPPEAKEPIYAELAAMEMSLESGSGRPRSPHGARTYP